MGISIKTAHCCGASCATVYEGEGFSRRRISFEQDWGEHYQKWSTNRYGGKDEAKEEWLSWLEAIKKALRSAIKEGKITQEQADQAFNEWLRDHPNPETGEVEQIPFDVTEEYERVREGVRVAEEAIFDR